ncbi:MAG: hypothetical protein K6E99_00460 [Bacilli bacterium]|nr:hypothetical protein [Bacilli bacterium]
MAISIEDFRKSLNIGLSRDLVQKIITKYENFDFSSVNTNNGTKLREIDAYDPENVAVSDAKDLSYFLNDTLKRAYLSSKGIDLNDPEADIRELKAQIKEASKIIKKSLYSKPNTLTISSKDILNNPQKDECSHILTINTDSSSIISILNSLYRNLAKYDIPFEIEIPRLSNMNDGQTEAIKLHVTSMDLYDTIRAISKLDKVYKNRIKKPNMFNANVNDVFGYDSVIDINGTRSSDVLGVAVIKAMDKTLVDLAKDIQFDNISVVDYLRNAENKDEARKRVMQRVKTDYPNIIDPVLLETVKVIKEEKLAINPDQIFVSDIAASELNVEFGTAEDEITNINEIEEEKEEIKTTNVIKEAAASVDTDIKAGVQSINDLFANQYIQPAITFGAIPAQTEEETATVDPSDSLKVENPTVTVIEPVEKTTEFNELTQPKFDSIDENVQPVLTADEPVVKATEEEFTLPGEETYAEPAQTPVSEMSTGIQEVVTPEVPAQETIEPKEVTPIVIPSIEASPIVIEPQTMELPVNFALPGEQVVAAPEVETPVETPVVEEPVEVAPVVETAPVVADEPVEVVAPVVSEPVVQAVEPVVQDDTAADLDKTQILAPVEQVQTPVSELPSGIKEIITPEVNPVPPYNPKDYEETPKVETSVEPQNELEEKLTKLENAPVDTRTIEIPTEEIKEESDILSAISSNLDVPDSSKLSTEEKIAVVADAFTKPVDPERQAKIDKYAGIFQDNQILDFRVRNENLEEMTKEDGTPYTFLDYLEDNKVLDKIKLDSKYYIKDDPSRDYVDGKTFIRDYVIPNSVNGNRSIEDIKDWYVKSETNINEQPKKKGIFGFGRK